MSKKEREAASEPMATMWSTKVLSQDVFRVCLCLGPVIKKKKKPQSFGAPRYLVLSLSSLTSILALKSLGISASP